MRMRRKSRLDERLKLCDRHLAVIEGKDFYKKPEEDRYHVISFKAIFGNENEVYLDLGCGNGCFSLDIAKSYRDRNYIGVEKISNVLICGAERAVAENPDNCIFFNCAVENLKYYLPFNSIAGIYLNFSCPFPKGTYQNRRLTYPRYLELYKVLLKQNGRIILKTDSEDFFEYSLETLKQCGFMIENQTRDLYNSPLVKTNIPTEYEKKFVGEGKKILSLIAYKI